MGIGKLLFGGHSSKSLHCSICPNAQYPIQPMNSYQSNLFSFSWEIRRGTIIHCNSYSDRLTNPSEALLREPFSPWVSGSVFCTGKLQQASIIFSILIYAKVCKVYYICLISLRDFENARAGLKVILIVRFIFC